MILRVRSCQPLASAGMSAITGLASAKAGSRQGPVMARRDAYLAHVPLGACRTRAAYLAPALDAHALVARPLACSSIRLTPATSEWHRSGTLSMWSLGYEQYDARLPRLWRPGVSPLSRAQGARPSPVSRYVFPSRLASLANPLAQLDNTEKVGSWTYPSVRVTLPPENTLFLSTAPVSTKT